MPTLTQIEEQGRALVAQQKALVTDESRPWSDKREEFDRIDKDIKELLEQHTAMKTVDGNGQFGALSDVKPVETTRRSIGEQFVHSEQFKGVKSAKGSRFSSGSVELKATLTEGAGGSGLLVPTYLPGVTQVLFQRLTIADLIPNGAASGSAVIYLEETAVTNAASSVAEGGAKPGSDLNTDQKTENFRKIATSLKIADEMLQDIPYVQSYVDGRLMLFVQIEEEHQLLKGNGTAPDLTGLLNRSGLTAAQAKGADSAIDAVFKEITKIRAGAFIDPSAIVMHPTDWQSVRLSKDANNQYYGGGPFTGAYGTANSSDRGNLGSGEMLWGLPVVVTTAIDQGTALVGAFSTCAQIFRKGGVTVEATNSNEDDFLHNLVAIRAEERLALAVYRPAGFGTVTGL